MSQTGGTASAGSKGDPRIISPLLPGSEGGTPGRAAPCSGTAASEADEMIAERMEAIDREACIVVAHPWDASPRDYNVYRRYVEGLLTENAALRAEADVLRPGYRRAVAAETERDMLREALSRLRIAANNYIAWSRGEGAFDADQASYWLALCEAVDAADVLLPPGAPAPKESSHG